MRILYLVLAASLASGCGTLSGVQEASRSSGDYSSLLKLSNQALAVLGQTTPSTLADNSPNDAVLIYLAKQEKDENKRNEAVSNAVISAYILNSDRLCEQYMANFLLKSRSLTAGLRIASLGLSTAAGVSTPVRSANVLSSLSAFASGSEEKLNESVLSRRSPELLYKSVMAVRSRERSRLLAIQASDIPSASKSAILLSQIADYHNQCGLTVGINQLEAAVQTSAVNAAQDGTTAASDFVTQATTR
jgi:hypothetical protein